MNNAIVRCTVWLVTTTLASEAEASACAAPALCTQTLPLKHSLWLNIRGRVHFRDERQIADERDVGCALTP